MRLPQKEKIEYLQNQQRTKKSFGFFFLNELPIADVGLYKFMVAKRGIWNMEYYYKYIIKIFIFRKWYEKERNENIKIH